MVEALIAGERDPQRLAELSKSRMRSKKDQLTKALAGRFAAHHGRRSSDSTTSPQAPTDG